VSRPVSGILTALKNSIFLKGSRGERHFQKDHIWTGYTKHWLNQKLFGRTLPQKDYQNNRPIVILWPEEKISEPYVDLLYNEKLTHYWESMMGHVAIDVNGKIFNFSNALNENEIITREEYFYRPALGEFAPDPIKGKTGIDEKGRPYYDKFGRLFMRTIHVLRIYDLDHEHLTKLLNQTLSQIHSSPIDPQHPENYAQFSVFKRSCSTFIRDALRLSGLPEVSGIMPRDLFINVAYHVMVQRKMRARLFRMPQLQVDEAPMSLPTRITVPTNWFRERAIRPLYS